MVGNGGVGTRQRRERFSPSLMARKGMRNPEMSTDCLARGSRWSRLYRQSHD